MKQEKQKNYGYLIYFAVIVILLLFTAWIGNRNNADISYTKGDLYRDIDDGKVVSVTISPYKQTPTGEISVQLKAGEVRTVYVLM